MLTPGGKLLVGNSSAAVEAQFVKEALATSGLSGAEIISQDANWTVLQKQAADVTDEWTHWNHGPDGNALSSDTKVQPPTHLKWSSGDESILSMSGPFIGWRITKDVAVHFHVDGRTVEGQRFMTVTGRNPYNGTKMWSRTDIFSSGGKRHNWQPAVVDSERLYAMKSASGPTISYNLKTGNPDRTFSNIVVDGNQDPLQLAIVDEKLIQFSGRYLYVVNKDNGNLIWKKELPVGSNFFGGIASKEQNKVFAILTKNIWRGASRWPTTANNEEIAAYDLNTGEQKWSNTSIKNYGFGQLVCYKGTVGAFGAQAFASSDNGSASIAMLDASSGKTRWVNNYGSILTKIPWHDSKMAAQHMAMRDNQAIASYGEYAIYWDIQNGAYKQWKYDQKKTGFTKDQGYSGRQGCVKGILTENWNITGLVVWVGKNMDYTFAPLRRAGCAEPGFVANGMTYWAQPPVVASPS